MHPGSPLCERDRLPTIFDADPSISCESDDGIESGNELENDKLGCLAEVASTTVMCYVPGCTVGMIDVRTSQHRCRNCGGCFHALCAFNVSGSDDNNDCGCLLRTQQGGEGSLLLQDGLGTDALPPPKDLPPQFIPAWLNGAARVNSKLRKPPKEFSAPDEAKVWIKAKEALRAHVKSEQRRARRVGLKRQRQTAEGLGHIVDPEYCAAAGKEYDVPQVAEKKRAPKATVGEIARLAHAMTNPSVRSATEIIMQGWSSRAELDDKIGRENPWESIAALFNDESFRPTNFYVDKADGFD